MAKSYYIPKHAHRIIAPPHNDDRVNRNPPVDIFVANIEIVDYTGFGTDNIVKQKAMITEDEIMRGFVPSNSHLEKRRVNSIMGLAMGLSIPSDLNSIRGRGDSDLTVGDFTYLNRVNSRRAAAGVEWDLDARKSKHGFKKRGD